MWRDGKDVDSIDNIYASYINGDLKKFPTKCPLCGAVEAHIYMHRHKPKEDFSRGGYWVWCSKCRASQHGSCFVPEEWENIEEVPISELTSHPYFLEKNKTIIDEFLNKKSY